MRVSSADFFFEQLGKKTLQHRVSIVIGLVFALFLMLTIIATIYIALLRTVRKKQFLNLGKYSRLPGIFFVYKLKGNTWYSVEPEKYTSTP